MNQVSKPKDEGKEIEEKYIKKWNETIKCWLSIKEATYENGIQEAKRRDEMVEESKWGTKEEGLKRWEDWEKKRDRIKRELGDKIKSKEGRRQGLKQWISANGYQGSFGFWLDLGKDQWMIQEERWGLEECTWDFREIEKELSDEVLEAFKNDEDGLKMMDWICRKEEDHQWTPVEFIPNLGDIKMDKKDQKSKTENWLKFKKLVIKKKWSVEEEVKHWNRLKRMKYREWVIKRDDFIDESLQWAYRQGYWDKDSCEVWGEWEKDWKKWREIRQEWIGDNKDWRVDREKQKRRITGILSIAEEGDFKLARGWWEMALKEEQEEGWVIWEGYLREALEKYLKEGKEEMVEWILGWNEKSVWGSLNWKSRVRMGNELDARRAFEKLEVKESFKIKNGEKIEKWKKGAQHWMNRLERDATLEEEGWLLTWKEALNECSEIEKKNELWAWMNSEIELRLFRKELREKYEKGEPNQFKQYEFKGSDEDQARKLKRI